MAEEETPTPLTVEAPVAKAPATITPSPMVDAEISSGRAFAPPIGTKIQVLWRIVYDDKNTTADQQPAPAQNIDAANTDDTEQVDNPNVVERWWGATVQDRTNEKVGAVSAPNADADVFVLLYDAYNEFPEETSRVAFLPDNVLLDLSMLNDDAQGGRLDWVDDPAMHLEQDSPSAIRSAECIAREADAFVRESGLPADADLRALATMPHSVQVHIATGYRSFADAIKRLLGELVASKPAGYVVTADDVHNIMSRVRSQRQSEVNS